MSKTTELDSHYNDLEKMNLIEILSNINQEDHKIAACVKKVIPDINDLVVEIITKVKNNGRIFYIGAGTSGRLGILDASECPPTFGVSHELFIGLIAGGDKAIRKAVEFAEDNKILGWHDLQQKNINSNDIVIGIAASGSTPYVVGALKKCQEN